MNREAVAEAIVDRYTYWPDMADEHALRREFISVRCFFSKLSIIRYMNSYFLLYLLGFQVTRLAVAERKVS